MKTNIEFINSAIKEALKSSMRYRHGAIIIYRNRIIGKGYNKYDLCCKKDIVYSKHAEGEAIKNCKDKRLIPYSFMLVVRIGTNKKMKMSYPCSKCLKLINKVGIKKTLYSSRKSYK